MRKTPSSQQLPVTKASTSAPVLDRSIARQAALWLVRLHDAHVSAADLAGCARWRAAHPDHERAWQRAEQIGSKLNGLPAGIALQSLGRSNRMERRTVLKTLLLLMALPASYVTYEATYRTLPWEQWVADLRTATGERRTITLADGSELILNTNSAVDVRFDSEQRLLILHTGEILIRTARDPLVQIGAATGAATAAGRPFVVRTRQGNIRALGTRFIVSAADTHPSLAPATNVTVLEHAVEIRPAIDAGRARVIEAGRQTSFTASAMAAPQAADPYAAAWVEGRLVVNAMRLDDFLVQLSRYRRALLRCEPQIASLRISGAFQLDNIDGILDALPDTLPVAVLYRSRYWVTVIPAAPVS